MRTLWAVLALGLTTVAVAVVTPLASAQDRDCPDFPDQRSAQAYYESKGGPESDPHQGALGGHPGKRIAPTRPWDPPVAADLGPPTALPIAQTKSTSSAPAIIAAAAAVVAALLAAFSTVGAEAWRTYLARRGVAGLLAEDLHRWEGTIVEAYYRESWWHEGELLQEQAREEDLKLAATSLGPSEWSALSSARRWVHYLEAVRKRRAAETARGGAGEASAHPPGLEGPERRWMAETFYRLEAARWGLQRAAASLPNRRPERLAASWRPYQQHQLGERFAPNGRNDRLTTLGDVEVLKALLKEGVSLYLSQSHRAEVLLPPQVREGAE
jgi:hypothetical protein